MGYGSERPVELQVPAPDVSADVTQAIKEIDSRRKADPLMTDNQEQRPDFLNLDHDVTQGIQSLGVDKTLGRRAATSRSRDETSLKKTPQ